MTRRLETAFLLLLLLLLLRPSGALTLRAGGRSVFGVEAGVMAGLYSHEDAAYISQEGYRDRDYASGIFPAFNGHFRVFGGWCWNDSDELSLVLGYGGIRERKRMYAADLRWKHLFPAFNAQGDRALVLVEGGAAQHWETRPDVYARLRLGGGIRLRLNSHSALDFSLALDQCAGSPAVYEGGVRLPKSAVLRSFAWYGGLSLSVSFVF